MIYKTILTGLLLILLTVPSVLAAECECPSAKESVRDASNSSSLIFVGRVETVSESPLKPGEYQVQLYVMKKIKGFEEVPTEYVTLYTPTTQVDCGYPFAGGLDYLVYAKGNPAHFMTTTCDRTALLDDARGEIKSVVDYVN